MSIRSLFAGLPDSPELALQRKMPFFFSSLIITSSSFSWIFLASAHARSFFLTLCDFRFSLAAGSASSSSPISFLTVAGSMSFSLFAVSQFSTSIWMSVLALAWRSMLNEASCIGWGKFSPTNFNNFISCLPRITMLSRRCHPATMRTLVFTNPVSPPMVHTCMSTCPDIFTSCPDMSVSMNLPEMLSSLLNLILCLLAKFSHMRLKSQPVSASAVVGTRLLFCRNIKAARAFLWSVTTVGSAWEGPNRSTFPVKFLPLS